MSTDKIKVAVRVRPFNRRGTKTFILGVAINIKLDKEDKSALNQTNEQH